MLKTLPATPRRNAPWTPLQRQAWLATRRRRERSRLAADVCPDLLDGLVAHFAFDESSDDRTDYDTGCTLTTVGSSVGSDAGILGSAAQFDGNGGYFESADETTMFSPTAGGFAVSLWVNFGTSRNCYSGLCIASVWDDANWPAGSSWDIHSDCPAAGDVTVEILGASTNSFSASTDLMSGWTHVCLVFDAAAVLWSLYLDGVLGATLACDYRPVSGRLCLGNHTNAAGGTPEFLLDELAVWSRNLSAVEVAQLYNNGSGLPREMF